MTLSPTMRQFLLAMAVLSAVGAGWRLAESFSPDELYRKDFIQEYVLAKATLAGEAPYLPMPDMVARWFDPATKVNWSHPTPHTPVTAVLSIPVAWLDYPLAAFLWLVFELVLLISVWAAFFRWWGDEGAPAVPSPSGPGTPGGEGRGEGGQNPSRNLEFSAGSAPSPPSPLPRVRGRGEVRPPR